MEQKRKQFILFKVRLLENVPKGTTPFNESNGISVGSVILHSHTYSGTFHIDFQMMNESFARKKNNSLILTHHFVRTGFTSYIFFFAQPLGFLKKLFFWIYKFNQSHNPFKSDEIVVTIFFLTVSGQLLTFNFFVSYNFIL